MDAQVHHKGFLLFMAATATVCCCSLLLLPEPKRVLLLLLFFCFFSFVYALLLYCMLLHQFKWFLFFTSTFDTPYSAFTWPLDEVPSRVTSKAEVELAREATDCVRCVWTKDEDEVREEVVVKISLECCRLLFVPVVVVVVVLLLLPEVGRRSSFFFLLEKSPLIRELMVNEEEVEGVRMWMGL